MKDMDKGIFSLGELIAQNELALPLLQKKKTVLLSFSYADIKKPKLMIVNRNKLTL